MRANAANPTRFLKHTLWMQDITEETPVCEGENIARSLLVKCKLFLEFITDHPGHNVIKLDHCEEQADKW
jgi:hypothetical protein